MFHICSHYDFLSTLTVDDEASRRLTPSVTLSPLLNAAPAIQIHAFAAIAAFVVGVIQLSTPKGTIPHRLIGVMGVADVDRRDQLAFHPRNPPVGSVEPYPPLIDPDAGDFAAGGAARPPSSGQQTSHGDADAVHRCSGDPGVFTFLPGRIMHSVAFGS
jgi:hypothetical protein